MSLDPSPPQDILIEAPTEAVALIRLNRSAVKNALRTQTLREVADQLDRAAADEAVRAVVITGTEGVFAAGADINEIADLGPQQALEDPRVEAWRSIRAFPKPLIAAVEGFCLGGGLELALSCDVIIAAQGAQFGLPEVKLGLMPGGGGTQHLPRLVGRSLASKMIFSGLFIDAAEAKAAGLAADAVETGGAEAAAVDLAARIARNAPFAVRQAKQAIRLSERLPLEDAIRAERHLFASLQATEDKAEGIASFREKRKPSFKGR